MRLSGSLPKDAIARLKHESDENTRYLAGFGDPKKRGELFEKHAASYFEKFDSLLDGSTSGPLWLQQDNVAQIVADAIQLRDGQQYDLYTWTIMPNHVHMVFSTVGRFAEPTISDGTGVPSYCVAKILSSLKKFTARNANKLLGRTGPFWQAESYDHVIRNAEELERTIWYVLNNPVKAKLTDTWQNWRWTFCKADLL